MALLPTIHDHAALVLRYYVLSNPYLLFIVLFYYLHFSCTPLAGP
jgi:hypothetical protein